ncbi:MAG: prolipoprotein diacylglyceryl transferase [Gammaproteobacteria bacterium]|nr:MAG: prolipoprotein diacylglyceryl transferase [Gammaproteobacteria bacterium]
MSCFIHPNFDPVAISFGKITLPVLGEIALDIRWYGLMYLIGFSIAWFLGVRRSKQENSGWQKEQVSDMTFYGAMGVVIGGRIGYVLFYNFAAFLENPLSLFQVWNGGMSFHGGFIGVLAAMFLFAKKTNKGFFEIGDFIAPLVPLGLGAGRMGNFINGELWGRATDVPWAMEFSGTTGCRHPSQLYEFALEGLALFIILWIVSSKRPRKIVVSSLFVLLYGSFRFFVEFFRQPDNGIGFTAGWITRGQLLSSAMILAGLIMLVLALRKKQTE